MEKKFNEEQKNSVKSKFNTGKKPTVKPHVYIAPGARVVGDVLLEEGVSIWYNATLRADAASITIGRDSNIQDNAVVHVDAGRPCVIGEKTTVGHGAIVHGCQVGSNSLIGMGAILLNGAKIGDCCLVGAGALVTEGQQIPDGSLVLGSPARVKRPLTEKEIADIAQNARVYIEEAEEHCQGMWQAAMTETEEEAVSEGKE